MFGRHSQPTLEEKTLEKVNEIRRAAGVPELTRLAPGTRGSAGGCVIANSLGDIGHASVSSSITIVGKKGRVQDIAHSIWTRAFINEFDSGTMPHLVDRHWRDKDLKTLYKQEPQKTDKGASSWPDTAGMKKPTFPKKKSIWARVFGISDPGEAINAAMAKPQEEPAEPVITKEMMAEQERIVKEEREFEIRMRNEELKAKSYHQELKTAEAKAKAEEARARADALQAQLELARMSVLENLGELSAGEEKGNETAEVLEEANL